MGDLWFEKELSRSHKSAGACLVTFLVIVVVFEGSAITFIAYTIVWGSCQFLLRYWSAAWSLEKTSKQREQQFMHMELYNADKEKGDENKAKVDNEANEDIPDSYSVVALPAVLKNVTTFGFFMQRCSKEFNTENLLYFCDCIHLIQEIDGNQHAKLKHQKKGKKAKTKRT